MIFIIHLCLGAIAHYLYGQPSGLEQGQNGVQYFATFLIFLFWFFGMMQWGKFFCKIFKWPNDSNSEKLLGQLALGSISASFVSGWVMIFSPLLAGKKFAFFYTLLGSFILFIQENFLNNKNSQRKKIDFDFIKKIHFSYTHFLKRFNEINLFQFISISFICIFVILKTIESFSLQSNGDPFICYLTAPVEWFLKKDFSPFLENPIFFLAGTWENLFLWGSFFLASPPNYGLDAVQRFSQWCSVYFGIFGIILAVYCFIKRIFSFKKDRFPIFEKNAQIIFPSVAFIAIIASTSIPILRPLITLSKNDIGLSFWALSSLVPLLQILCSSSSQSNRSLVILSGVLLGASVIGKPPYVVFGFSIGIFFILFNSFSIVKKIQMAFFFVCGGILGSSFVLYRNWLFTNNPFFPWLQNFFLSSIMGPSLANPILETLSSEKARNHSLFFDYLKEVFTQQPWTILGLVGLFFLNKIYQFLFLITLLSSILFCYFFRGTTEIRYLSPTLILMSALSIYSGFVLLTQIPVVKIKYKNYRFNLSQKIFLIIFSLFVMIEANLSLFTFAQLGKEKFNSGAVTIASHTGGLAKKWLRTHASDNDLILSFGDNEFYYMIGKNFKDIYYHPEIDRLLYKQTNPHKILEILKNLNTQYVYFLNKNIPYYVQLQALLPWFKEFPECRVYQDMLGEIFQINCLVQSVQSSYHNDEFEKK